VVAVGVPHHVTQRGNNRQTVFFSNADRQVYLALLRDHCERWGLDVLGYCLMSNHVHVVGVPGAADSLAKALGRTHYDYAVYLNGRRHRSGHLWQNRFFSTAMDRGHLYQTLRYVDLNPVRAGMVERGESYRWSSARAHVEGHDAGGLLRTELDEELCRFDNWAEVLTPSGSDSDAAEAIRRATRTGRPLGDEKFVKDLAVRLDRDFGKAKPGPRPKRRLKGESAAAGMS